MKKLFLFFVLVLAFNFAYANYPSQYKTFTIKNATRYRVKVVINNQSATQGFSHIINPCSSYVCNRAQCGYSYPRVEIGGLFGEKYVLTGFVTIPRCGNFRMLPNDKVTIELCKGKIVCKKAYRW